jgi:hypothetical protein
MKSRSSTGVGQKIDLEYNIETMRITDNGADENTDSSRRPSVIMDQIKSSSRVMPNSEHVDTNTGEIVPIKADVQSNKLKQMLAGLKTQST